jgi:hypothetical protein
VALLRHFLTTSVLSPHSKITNNSGEQLLYVHVGNQVRSPKHGSHSNSISYANIGGIPRSSKSSHS